MKKDLKFKYKIGDIIIDSILVLKPWKVHLDKAKIRWNFSWKNKELSSSISIKESKLLHRYIILFITKILWKEKAD